MMMFYVNFDVLVDVLSCPGYILRPGYRGHWSLVDITYYMSLCNIIIYYKTVCNIFYTLYTHYFFSVADLPGVHI